MFIAALSQQPQTGNYSNTPALRMEAQTVVVSPQGMSGSNGNRRPTAGYKGVGDSHRHYIK